MCNRLVVGLGNAESKYKNTPHNLGRDAVRFAIKSSESAVLEIKLKIKTFGMLWETGLDEPCPMFLLPDCGMNDSGKAVKEITEDYGVELKNVLIVYDDLDLPFGSLRLRAKGSDGRHKGMGSVIKELGTEEIARLRIGVGGTRGMTAMERVLSPMDDGELELLPKVFKDAAEIINHWLKLNTQGTLDWLSKGKSN